MQTITPEAETAELEDLFASTKRAVSDLRRELEGLKDQVSAGGETHATSMAKQLSSVGDMIGRCHKAETYLHDCRKRQAGIAKGDFAFDLNQARAEIGCKLDRLRCTRLAKKVP